MEKLEEQKSGLQDIYIQSHAIETSATPPHTQKSGGR